MIHEYGYEIDVMRGQIFRFKAYLLNAVKLYVKYIKSIFRLSFKDVFNYIFDDIDLGISYINMQKIFL